MAREEGEIETKVDQQQCYLDGVEKGIELTMQKMGRRRRRQRLVAIGMNLMRTAT